MDIDQTLKFLYFLRGKMFSFNHFAQGIALSKPLSFFFFFVAMVIPSTSVQRFSVSRVPDILITFYNFLKPEIPNLSMTFMYSIDWQSPGVLTCTPAIPVASSESRITDWETTPSVGVTTQLVQRTAQIIFKLSRGLQGALKKKKKMQHIFVSYFSFSKPYSRIFWPIFTTTCIGPWTSHEGIDMRRV